ncbi:MAG: maleylpyruvate isomerase N-terminal domain-containing protein [Nocardioidaceae bacterium]
MTNTPSARVLLPTAAARFGEVVHGVPPDGWSSQSPCDEWSVRDVTNHLVSEHSLAPHLLRGETVEQVGSCRTGSTRTPSTGSCGTSSRAPMR